MSASVAPTEAELQQRAPAAPRNASAGRLRASLIVGCALAVAVATGLGNPDLYQGSDAGLARLLRGMGAVKGLIALGVVAVLSWRFRHPIAARAAAAYTAGTWMLAGASVLILQLSFIRSASGLFWAGVILLLVGAWSDRRG
jgi:hypothetical protein